MIQFLGIDGSGKTTQAKRLVETLERERIDCVYAWCRREPVVTKLPARLFKRFVLRERERTESTRYVEVRDNRRRVFSNPLLRAAWQWTSMAEYLAVFMLRSYPALRRHGWAVCDRYVGDAIVDLALSSPAGFEAELDSFLRSSLVRAFPRPDLVIFLDVDAELAAARKDDGTSVAYLADRVPAYRALAAKLGAVHIDGSLSENEVAARVATAASTLVGAGASE
jgi:dTMP kinase